MEVRFAATVTSAPRYFTGPHGRHEAFDVRRDDGSAVEVVDNVDIAPPCPVAVGDRIAIKGELVRDDRNGGSLVHWTHHDPAHVHAGGYLVLGGVRYS